MNFLWAEYHPWGYDIWLHDEKKGKESIIYQAGNDPRESSGVVSRHVGLSLSQVRKYAISTLEEISAEMRIPFTGAFRVAG